MDLQAGVDYAAQLGLLEEEFVSKLMKEFAEKANKTEVKGGLMDNAAIDAKVVEKLAATPSKEVLLTKLMWSITGSVRSLAVGLNAVKEKMEA